MKLDASAYFILYFGIFILIFGGVIWWLFCRWWADFGSRDIMGYSHLMRKHHLPISIELSTEQILGWLRLTMEEYGFTAVEAKIVPQDFLGGKGFIFEKETFAPLRIFVRELPENRPGGETQLLIEKPLPKKKTDRIDYIVANSPFHEGNGGPFHQGGLLFLRYWRFRELLECALNIRLASQPRDTTMAEDPIRPI